MHEVVLFLLTFIIVLIGYEIFIISKTRSKKTKHNIVYQPVEVTYLTNIYKVNLDDINYKKLLKVIALTTSFDISVVVSVISYIHNFYLEIIMAMVLVIFMILVSYHLVYLYIKRGGMKND